MAIFLTRGTKLQNCLNLDGFDIFDTLVNEGFFSVAAADFTFVIIASQDTDYKLTKVDNDWYLSVQNLFLKSF